jgi:predicted small secreted protein
MKTILSFIVLILVAFALAGCSRTIYVPGPASVKTEIREQVRVDSIWQLDSVYVRERGDTVYVDRVRTAYKYQLRIDSLVITDTLRITEIREVNYITGVQHFQIWTGRIALVLLAAALLALIVWLAVKLKVK